MTQYIFKYLKSYSTDPLEVDRLIVSAFVEINSLSISENKFLKKYLIPNDTEEFFKLNQFIEVLQKVNKKFNLEDLIELFEFVVSPSDRIINGAIYTPKKIREYITKQAFNKNKKQLANIKIADIACGCSSFLYSASKELKKKTSNSYQFIFQNQIFGLDIQEYSITRSKILLSLLAISEGEDIKEFNFNLYQGDALTFSWNSHYKNFEGFEIILGNPPYVCARNLSDSIKENLKKWSVTSTGNPDLYIPFFQIGFESLAKDGFLGYITMNSFFKSLNGRALRKYFSDNKASIKIIDFGIEQIFKSKSTYTCVCFLEKIQNENIEYYKSKKQEFPKSKSDYTKINYSKLDSFKGWNLNNYKVITQIESTGIPFGELFKTRHGIATLKNDIYIFNPVKEDNDFFYLQNGSLYPIEKGICRDIVNTNKLSRPSTLNKLREKVIFPYNNLDKPNLLDENYLKDNYPNAYKYLQNKKKILAGRDKGKGEYENWFAFGRSQSLEKVKNKLFFPKISDRTPNFIINSDDTLMFYNGQAVIGHSEEEMLFVKKIMESELFWYYIQTTSKPYSSSYYSLNGNYIKNFGIYNFSEEDKKFVINENDKRSLNNFINDKYKIKLS